MIRGDTIEQFTAEQLNDVEDHSNNVTLVIQEFEKLHGDSRTKKGRAAWEKWAKENDAKLRVAIDKDADWYNSPLYGSQGLRAQCIEAGYKVIDIYPCYHQGWEMDEWGAIGEKDGQKWQLETSHGGLIIPTEPIKGIVKTVMNMLGFK